MTRGGGLRPLLVVLAVAYVMLSCQEMPTRSDVTIESTAEGVLSSCSPACAGEDPVSPAAPGYVRVQTPSPGSRGGFALVPMPGAFGEATLVYARASGLVSKVYADSWIWPVNIRGTATVPLDPNGWAWGSAFQCVGNLEFRFSRGRTPASPLRSR